MKTGEYNVCGMMNPRNTTALSRRLVIFGLMMFQCAWVKEVPNALPSYEKGLYPARGVQVTQIYKRANDCFWNGRRPGVELTTWPSSVLTGQGKI